MSVHALGDGGGGMAVDGDLGGTGILWNVLLPQFFGEYCFGVSERHCVCTCMCLDVGSTGKRLDVM